MTSRHRRRGGLLSGRLGDALGTVSAGVVQALFGLMRPLGPDRASRLGGALARTLGPLLPVNRVGRSNLRSAYPGKSETEIRAILGEVWDNLGRTVAEYPFLPELFDYDPDPAAVPGRIEVTGTEHFLKLREEARPAIIFSAHLANWELPAVAAARFGLDATVVFRPPNGPASARAVEAFRSRAMGILLPSGPGAASRMVAVLERGGHLGMLADQHLTLGLIVPFFGRPALANPVLAKLARRFDCGVHGARCIRLPGGRFRLELTPPLDLPRDAEGAIDVERATAHIASVIEGWVREEPGQWLWLHRRWRVRDPAQPQRLGVSSR